MKTIRIVGIILILLGVLGFVFQGISYTKQKTIVDIGPLEARSEEKKTIPIHPVVSAALLGSGVVLLVFGRKSTGQT